MRYRILDFSTKINVSISLRNWINTGKIDAHFRSIKTLFFFVVECCYLLSDCVNVMVYCFLVFVEATVIDAIKPMYSWSLLLVYVKLLEWWFLWRIFWSTPISFYFRGDIELSLFKSLSPAYITTLSIKCENSTRLFLANLVIRWPKLNINVLIFIRI